MKDQFLTAANAACMKYGIGRLTNEQATGLRSWSDKMLQSARGTELWEEMPSEPADEPLPNTLEELSSRTQMVTQKVQELNHRYQAIPTTEQQHEPTQSFLPIQRLVAILIKLSTSISKEPSEDFEEILKQAVDVYATTLSTLDIKRKHLIHVVDELSTIELEAKAGQSECGGIISRISSLSHEVKRAMGLYWDGIFQCWLSFTMYTGISNTIPDRFDNLPVVEWSRQALESGDNKHRIYGCLNALYTFAKYRSNLDHCEKSALGTTVFGSTLAEAFESLSQLKNSEGFELPKVQERMLAFEKVLIAVRATGRMLKQYKAHKKRPESTDIGSGILQIAVVLGSYGRFEVDANLACREILATLSKDLEWMTIVERDHGNMALLEELRTYTADD
ncbi:hypothetical protein BJ508DRAFT_362298 [Ascobolus immersus RN42]|uniref:Uncharacterized protein n=1 Tax=Ascobolus immersus RN42 TaxID=1160509 RepID=A0A3N4I604_ASCIM|nr:hypothetical protein BJ508DRAFT_362298 [Ascobolus immersus RN42]